MVPNLSRDRAVADAVLLLADEVPALNIEQVAEQPRSLDRSYLCWANPIAWI
jgi:hypothetical protein